ncbi:MAG: NDP-hexose 2,3-dehydratase family protein [Fibrobacteria bacterium]|nr:NDP-hexose 2,3-dehydratase family protein [Fibrobacteria bacterium]
MKKIPNFIDSLYYRFNSEVEKKKVLDWVAEIRAKVNVSVNRTELSQLKNWHFNGDSISHVSNKFFKIIGIKVETNFGRREIWHQPIILQPEIGILGFIVCKINNVYHFLVQAKIEPGNINFVQLSPTIQATRSNFTKVHGGKNPLFLDFFMDHSKARVLYDQLQSEQGSRFFKKRNRNIIVEVIEDIEIPENFKWLSLGQLKELMKIDNLVNMDSRTVLSLIDYDSLNDPDLNISNKQLNNPFINSYKCGIEEWQNYMHWLSSLKFSYDLYVKEVSLSNLSEWYITPKAITRKDNKYFEVIFSQIAIENREVASWDQPLIRPIEPGIIILITKVVNNARYLLVQAKVESGNFDVVEIAPTIQCITGSYLKPEYEIPYFCFFENMNKYKVLVDTLQSEEGGRFFNEENRNIIIEIGEGDLTKIEDERYTWISLRSINDFMIYNNIINIQLRSLISILDIYE